MTVYKRKVFYLSGFDPRGARFYYQTYKQQAARYAEATGHSITVGEREWLSDHEISWQVENSGEGSRTDYSFLLWDDIVRDAWIKNPVTLFRRCTTAYISYLKNLRWTPTMKLHRAALITFFYPPVTLMLLPLLFFAIAAALLPLWLALTVTALASVGVLHWIKSLWLLRFFIFNRENCRWPSAALEERLQHFAGRIAEESKGDYDEILLISHSNGSILAVTLMEKLLRLSGGALPAHFHLLTLGQCIPLVSYMEDARALRASLAYLAQHDFSWVDVSYPPDGACCARANFFLPENPDYRTKLQLFSPRFFRFQPPKDYKRLLRNRFLLHFRYLMDGDSPSALNFIGVTAGNGPLTTRTKTFAEAA